METYSLQALAGRDFAFDGTVAQIAPGGSAEGDLGYQAVTFEVNEWFRGGGGRQVTIALPGPGQLSSVAADLGDGYAVGTRLLVSGEPRWGGQPLEEPIGWLCGFTRYQDEQTAAQWRTALSS